MLKLLLKPTFKPDSFVFDHIIDSGMSASSTLCISFVLTFPRALAHSKLLSAICLGLEMGVKGSVCYGLAWFSHTSSISYRIHKRCCVKWRSSINHFFVTYPPLSWLCCFSICQRSRTPSIFLKSPCSSSSLRSSSPQLESNCMHRPKSKAQPKPTSLYRICEPSMDIAV